MSGIGTTVAVRGPRSDTPSNRVPSAASSVVADVPLERGRVAGRGHLAHDGSVVARGPLREVEGGETLAIHLHAHDPAVTPCSAIPRSASRATQSTSTSTSRSRPISHGLFSYGLSAPQFKMPPSIRRMSYRPRHASPPTARCPSSCRTATPRSRMTHPVILAPTGGAPQRLLTSPASTKQILTYVIVRALRRRA